MPASDMSQKTKASTLPPLEDSHTGGQRSPREGRQRASYDRRSGAPSPGETAASRSPATARVNPPGQANPPRRKTEVAEVQELRGLCIGSPVPDTEPHMNDMLIPSASKTIPGKPRPFNKTPSITINKVEALDLGADVTSPSDGQHDIRPLSPVSYDRGTSQMTPFGKSQSSDKLLYISPSTPPVQRKGNRQVITYYREDSRNLDVGRSRSDGSLPSSLDAEDFDYETSRQNMNPSYRDERKRAKARHARRSLSPNTMATADVSPSLRRHQGGRELSLSPRLTRRARQQESSSQDSEPPDVASPRDISSSSGSPRPRDFTPSPRLRRQARDASHVSAEISPNTRRKLPVRLDPL